jgi:hypothetical protein
VLGHDPTSRRLFYSIVAAGCTGSGRRRHGSVHTERGVACSHDVEGARPPY